MSRTPCGKETEADSGGYCRDVTCAACNWARWSQTRGFAPRPEHATGARVFSAQEEIEALKRRLDAIEELLAP